jgi:hypothetical protein
MVAWCERTEWFVVAADVLLPPDSANDSPTTYQQPASGSTFAVAALGAAAESQGAVPPFLQRRDSARMPPPPPESRQRPGVRPAPVFSYALRELCITLLTSWSACFDKSWALTSSGGRPAVGDPASDAAAAAALVSRQLLPTAAQRLVAFLAAAAPTGQPKLTEANLQFLRALLALWGPGVHVPGAGGVGA